LGPPLDRRAWETWDILAYTKTYNERKEHKQSTAVLKKQTKQNLLGSVADLALPVSRS
jgi:hypothetical protein